MKTKSKKSNQTPAPAANEKSSINQKRETLKALSKSAKELVKSGAYKSINAALIASYSDDTHQTFKSFHDWKAEGYRIRKGEHGFLVWGSPVTVKNEDESYEYFPVTYIFSNAQVVRPDALENTLNEIKLSYSNPVRPSEIKLSYSNPVKPAHRKTVCSSGQIEKILREIWDPNTIELQERFYVIFLNRANHVLGFYPTSVGGISGTVADPRLIFAAAIKCHASNLILAHNHPSGNKVPSQSDIQLTKNIVQSGKLLEINCLDHIILTVDSYYSFADEGLID